MSLTGLDYWRLADELSVIDAAFLIIGLDPGSHILLYPSDPARTPIKKDDGQGTYIAEHEFRAVFKSLRSAILAERLRANLTHLCRDVPYRYYGGDVHAVPPSADEDSIDFNALLWRGDGKLFSNAGDIGDGPSSTVYYVKEPDWDKTLIDVEDLKKWLSAKGLAPPFFFPTGMAEGFRDKNHVRYSPKLACAVAAWEAVRKNRRTMSVKATVAEWVHANGVSFGLADAEGVPPVTAVEEISKIVNWATGGGANKTGGEDENSTEAEDVREVKNYREIRQLSSTTTAFDEEEIPF